MKTYTSKISQIKRIEQQLRSHREVLSKYENNPPQHPHEHKARELSERMVGNLESQHNSLINNS